MDLNLVEDLLNVKFSEEEFEDCFLIDVEYSKVNNKLQVFIDSDSEFGFDKCRKISRYLESHFDAHGTLGEKYTLEVSSPGLSRPLKLKRQYVKNIGRLIRINLTNNGREEGRLRIVGEDDLEIEVKNKTKRIKFEEIKNAKILPSFK